MHLRQLDYVLAGLRAYAKSGEEARGQSSSWAEWVSLNNTDERE